MLPTSEPLRYERKFLITDYSHSEVKQLLKFHPACFSEIFYERNVNNIYFDTLGMNHYYDNIEGTTERLKIRIRWYGDLFGNIQKPVLEYKIKKGLLGKKKSYSLNPFILDNKFNKQQIITSINNKIIPQLIKDEVVSLNPVLLNCYTRNYFLSADKNFRITIDHHLNYYGIGYTENTFCNRYVDHKTIVLELKYDSSLENDAKEVGNLLPFALTKSSKYLQGLDRIFV